MWLHLVYPGFSKGKIFTYFLLLFIIEWIIKCSFAEEIELRLFSQYRHFKNNKNYRNRFDILIWVKEQSTVHFNMSQAKKVIIKMGERKLDYHELPKFNRISGLNQCFSKFCLYSNIVFFFPWVYLILPISPLVLCCKPIPIYMIFDAASIGPVASGNFFESGCTDSDIWQSEGPVGELHSDL